MWRPDERAAHGTMSEALQAVPAEFVQALRELGLSDAAALSGMPLTGGVSSDIWRIELPAGPVCAKRALAQLRASGQRAALVGAPARPLGLVTIKDILEEISGELARW